MKTKGKSIFLICLAMIVSGVILFSVIYSGQMVSAAQRVETYKDNGEDESEMTQESIQSQEKTVGEQAEYMEGVGGRTEYCTFRNTGSDGGAKCAGSKMNTIERALQTMTLTKKPTEDVCGLLRRWNIQRSGISVISESGGGVVPEPSELVEISEKELHMHWQIRGMRRSGCRIDTGGVGTKLIIWQKAVCFCKAVFWRSWSVWICIGARSDLV